MGTYADDDVLELAPTGRSSCQVCRGPIAKGQPRFGQLDGFRGEQISGYYHVDCAADRIPDTLAPWLGAGLLGDHRDEIAARIERARAAGFSRGLYPYAEIAPTGRATCVRCETTIANGELRAVILRDVETSGGTIRANGYLHLTCVAPHFGRDVSPALLWHSSRRLDANTLGRLTAYLSGSAPAPDPVLAPPPSEVPDDPPPVPVPASLGLDANGMAMVPYGLRVLTVGFDESLQLFVLDERSERHRRLPKPGPGDDPYLAGLAKVRWKSLQEAAKRVAKRETGRLEESMLQARRWSIAHLRALIAHPLAVHLARGVIFGAYVDDALRDTFRVAEDKTLVSIDGRAWTPPDGARIGVVHPIELAAAEVDRWREILSEHRIAQPIEQLERAVVRAAVDRAAHVEGLLHRPTSVARLDALRKLGWRRGPKPYGYVGSMLRPLLPRGHAVLELRPGIQAKVPAPQTPCALRIEGGSLDDLSALLFSELARELATLRAD